MKEERNYFNRKINQMLQNNEVLELENQLNQIYKTNTKKINSQDIDEAIMDDEIFELRKKVKHVYNGNKNNWRKRKPFV